MAEMLFIGSVFLIFFAYFGYPFTLVLAGWVSGRDVKTAMIVPRVTFIITVHNEEKRIKDKLENTLSLDYPKVQLQILVASDGSTDRTIEIARDYSNRGVELLDIADRAGKENAQKEAVKKATGEVIVFSDVATMLERGGLQQLVSNFADPTVGCVSSEDRLSGRNGKPSGEGFYVRYEMWLRRLESRANSLVGLSGSLFAARKEVCEDFSSEMQSDFRTVLNSIRMGLRGISDPRAIGFYQDGADPTREWDRKIRTVLRGLTVFFGHLDLLNVLQYGLFSYQLFCHKLLRWSVPFFLIFALFSNFILASESLVFFLTLLLHVFFYSLGILGLRQSELTDKSLIKIPMYFLAVNISILVAWWRYLKGQRTVMWAPTTR
ncbi:MAG: glycosyltransferase family 2 protein [Nitrososphaera sp.]|nr:glycosyltransferase family 2 protein [Nitrososphaera sp.]